MKILILENELDNYHANNIRSPWVKLQGTGWTWNAAKSEQSVIIAVAQGGNQVDIEQRFLYKKQEKRYTGYFAKSFNAHNKANASSNWELQPYDWIILRENLDVEQWKKDYSVLCTQNVIISTIPGEPNPYRREQTFKEENLIFYTNFFKASTKKFGFSLFSDQPNETPQQKIVNRVIDISNAYGKSFWIGKERMKHYEEFSSLVRTFKESIKENKKFAPKVISDFIEKSADLRNRVVADHRKSSKFSLWFLCTNKAVNLTGSRLARTIDDAILSIQSDIPAMKRIYSSPSFSEDHFYSFEDDSKAVQEGKGTIINKI